MPTNEPLHVLPHTQSHPRTWRDNLYVYAVISRRSGGLSIGINLNPDAACNFDCIYCQVDRTQSPRVRHVDAARLGDELATMIRLAQSGELFVQPEFASVPAPYRIIRDIAFSGDGEPTTSPVFAEVVALVIRLRDQAASDAKLVLITDACYLTRPAVAAGLRLMDAHGGQIWAKLDAGTQEYFQQVNKPNVTLAHVLENITAASRERSVVIQSLFMRIAGRGPNEGEIGAYVQCLRRIRDEGGQIGLVQVYTVARPPAQASVTPLAADEVDRIAQAVQMAGFSVSAYYGPG